MTAAPDITAPSGAIDLRSDTVTQPTPAMRAAMAAAVVGDDAYGEDPTVAALEAKVAALLGKDRALFVPSGTMGNQIALALLTTPGTNVVAGWRAHVVNNEKGAAARNALVQFVTVDDQNGQLLVDDVRWSIEAGNHHQLEVSAIAVENTHMCSGGTPAALDVLHEIAGLGLPVHMDGARLFNATVATGVAPADYARTATTVMVCLSKGLAAPVGSVLALPSSLYDRAVRERKRLGGQMRQAGILAAAGIVALDTMVDRLAEDHRRAARLRAAIDRLAPAAATDAPGGTNIVCFEANDTTALLSHLEANRILAGTIAPGVMRFVTHHGVDDGAIDHVIDVLQRAPL